VLSQFPEQEEFQPGQQYLAMSGIGRQPSDIQAEPPGPNDPTTGDRFAPGTFLQAIRRRGRPSPARHHYYRLTRACAQQARYSVLGSRPSRVCDDKAAVTPEHLMQVSRPGADHVRPVARSCQRTADDGTDRGLPPDEEDPGGDRACAR
jgi:hypothetical protein